MIIVKLDGGMGNQLFQYAVGKYLAEKHGVELKLDVDSYMENKNRQYSLHHFAIKEVFCSQKEKKPLKRKEYISRQLRKLGVSIKPYWCTEQNPGYHDYVQQLTDNVYLEGFWQSEKYFKPIENVIRKEFMIKESPSDLNKRCLDKIRSANAVSVHVRRGDYVLDEVTHAVHGVCDLDYYRTAIDHLTTTVDDPQFFIFSDDMEWTKNNLVINRYSATYIDHNAAADHEDIRLMYSCKHHIIANSSFSWWGAWLGDHAGKRVIAPKKWFQTLTNNDIIPHGWLTL